MIIRNRDTGPTAAPVNGTESRWDRVAYFLLFATGFLGFYVGMFAAVIAYVPAITVTAPYRATVLFLSAVILFFSMANGRGPRWNWVFGLVLFFFVALTLRILAEGYFSTFSNLPRPPDTMLALLWGAGFVPMLAFARPVSVRMQDLGLYGFLSTAFVAAGLGTYLYRDFFVGGYGRVRTGEFVGDFISISPLSLAYIGSALMVVGLALLSEPGGRRRGRLWSFGLRKSLGLAAVGLGLLPFFIGSSRGAFIALLVCGIVLFFARLNRRRIFGGIIALAVGSGIFLVVLFYGDRFESNVAQRVLSIQSDIESGDSRSIRLLIWEETIKGFSENPLAGAGMSPELGGHPHNAILEAFYTTGLFGGAAFLVVVSVCLVRALGIVKRHPHHAWIGLLFIHYFMNAMFSNSIAHFPHFWYSFALVFGTHAALEARRPAPRKAPQAQVARRIPAGRPAMASTRH